MTFQSSLWLVNHVYGVEFEYYEVEDEIGKPFAQSYEGTGLLMPCVRHNSYISQIEVDTMKTKV